MAKKSSQALAVRPTIIMAGPQRRSGGKVRRYARKAGHLARRGAGALARGAFEEKLALTAVAGAGVIGYLDGAGHLDMVPDLGLGRVPTLAAVAYFGGKFAKSSKLRQAGIGLAAAAAFGFGLDKGRQSKK